MDKNLGIGFDIGGSHISGAIVDLKQFRVIPNTNFSLEVNSKGNTSDILNQWEEAIKKILSDVDKHKIEVVGIAMPGPFDYEMGISLMKGVEKYNSLFGVDIKQFYSRFFEPETNIQFVNDATAFAIGESYFGIGKSYKKSLVLTLGTGFGSTFIHNKVPVYDGAGISPGGFLYNQKFKDSTADDHFSSRWFIREYRNLAGKEIHGVKELGILASGGNHFALEIFKEFGENLGEFLTPWLIGSRVEALIIGGNISRTFDLFREPLENKLIQNNLKVTVQNSSTLDDGTILGAVRFSKLNNVNSDRSGRKSSQYLLPRVKKKMPEGHYDIYPGHPTEIGAIKIGVGDLVHKMAGYKNIILEGYIGVFWNQLKDQIDKEFVLSNIKANWYDFSVATKNSEDIEKITEPYLGGDDPVFGKKAELDIRDFFEQELIENIMPDKTADINILYGTGSALCDWPDALLVYIDIPKNELQFRMRAGSVFNLGTVSISTPKQMYKRFYFVDWVVLNKHKRYLLPKIDIIADGQQAKEITWTSGNNLRTCLKSMS